MISVPLLHPWKVFVRCAPANFQLPACCLWVLYVWEGCGLASWPRWSKVDGEIHTNPTLHSLRNNSWELGINLPVHLLLGGTIECISQIWIKLNPYFLFDISCRWFTVTNLPAMQESWIPGSGRSPGEGNGNPLQYFCLENPMDRGAWQTAVREVTGSHVSHTHTHTRTHIANELFALEALSQNLLIGKPNLRQLWLLRVEWRKFMWAVMNPHINSFFRSALHSRLVTAIMSPNWFHCLCCEQHETNINKKWELNPHCM